MINLNVSARSLLLNSDRLSIIYNHFQAISVRLLLFSFFRETQNEKFTVIYRERGHTVLKSNRISIFSDLKTLKVQVEFLCCCL